MIHQYDRGDSSSPKRFRTFIFMNMRMKPVISILFYERDHWFKSFHVIRYSLSYKLMVLKITFSCLFVKSPVFILVIHKPLEALSKTDKRLLDQLSLSISLVLVLMGLLVLVLLVLVLQAFGSFYPIRPYALTGGHRFPNSPS